MELYLISILVGISICCFIGIPILSLCCNKNNAIVQINKEKEEKQLLITI
jgi:hypothetical protein